MMKARARWLVPLVVCLILTGCAHFSLPGSLSTTEADLFALGMDRYIEMDDLSTLESLSRMYPNSPWRTRAEAVIALANSQDQLQKQLVAVGEKLATVQSRLDAKKKQQMVLQKEHDALLRQKYSLIQEKDLLAQDNQSLEMTLERLKKVLIDTELQN